MIITAYDIWAPLPQREGPADLAELDKTWPIRGLGAARAQLQSEMMVRSIRSDLDFIGKGQRSRSDPPKIVDRRIGPIPERIESAVCAKQVVMTSATALKQMAAFVLGRTVQRCRVQPRVAFYGCRH